MTSSPARNTTRIQLTAADVENGEPEDSCRCPVALAVARAIGDPAALIDVDGDHITVQQAGIEWYADAPDEVKDFIEQFDHEADKRAGLQQAADMGLLAYELEWHEGTPPEADWDELRDA